MYITKEEAKDLIPILKAFIDGKVIKMWNGIYQEGEEKQYVDIDTSELLPLTFRNGSPIGPKDYFKIDDTAVWKKPDPCIDCKHHCAQRLLEGGLEWVCAYTSCKYSFKNANPKEAEYD